MPYRIQPAGKGKAYVVSTDTGKKHSKKPLPVSRAKRQLAALYIHVKDASK